MTSEDFKISRLAKISDEVGELHPMLKVLFRKLPNITSSEYTHGANEQGADFVLQKHDPTLGRTSYVGVIVKRDNISPSDLAPLYSQIEQCEVQRTFDGGKRNIRLNEVWVLTSGTISHSSRENICQKYETRKVNFIARDDLIKLIDLYFPAYWTDIRVDVGDYLSQILSEIDAEDQSANLLPDADSNFYVAQNVYRISELIAFNRGQLRKKPSKINLLLETAKKQFLLVEGEPGAGKSKLLRQLAREIAAPTYFIKEKRLPVYAAAKEFFGTYKGDVEKLCRSRFGINAGLFEDLENEIILLLDGLDESKRDHDEMIESLNSLSLALRSTPRVHVIATSRPLLIPLGPNEIKKPADWDRLELLPLTNAQLFQFIKHLCKNLSESNRLFEDIKDSPILKELPKSPIAAILLSDILRQKVEELPSTLPELYSKYFEVILGRWEIKKGLQSQREFEALEAVLMQIAAYVVENELNEISLDEAKDYFKNYLSERNLGIKADELLGKLERRFEIAKVNTKDNTFKFKHKTFAEFLYAKSLLRKEGVKVTHRAFEVYWLNSYYFYVGLKRDCPELLKQIVDFEPENEIARWVKIEAMGSYLLAAYTSPYTAIRYCMKKIVLEAANICFNDIHLRKGTFGSHLSEMHLVWLFQYSFKQRFGYKFFEKAIVDIALEISEMKILDEEKAFALFLLNTTHIWLGGEECFDFVLDAKLNNVPLCVQLGMKHEGGDFTLKDARFKRFDKHLQKTVLQGPKTKTLMHRLYEVPLAKRTDK